MLPVCTLARRLAVRASQRLVRPAALPVSTMAKRFKATQTFQPTAGPDAPQTEDFSAGLPRWPASELHDQLQYHFFFEGLFVQARVFLTPSLEEHSLWIFDHAEGKVRELVNSSEKMNQATGDHLSLSSSHLQILDGPGGGEIAYAGKEGKDALKVTFKNKHVFSWLPAGQGKDAVIHRPDLEISLEFNGKTMTGRGYSKRYYGDYGPHWGYRFIQSSSLPGDRFLWTADATFRLGSTGLGLNGLPEAKYNYFKLLNGRTGQLTQADSRDTYQQDCEGFAHIDGKRYIARVTPLGEWLHDYKAGQTNSRMQLRYCKVELDEGDGSEPVVGYALNERCFGTL